VPVVGDVKKKDVESRQGKSTEVGMWKKHLSEETKPTWKVLGGVVHGMGETKITVCIRGKAAL